MPIFLTIIPLLADVRTVRVLFNLVFVAVIVKADDLPKRRPSGTTPAS